MKFGELVGSADTILGIRSVYGMVEGSYVGFSDRDRLAEVAESARARPFLLAMGTLGATSAVAGRLINVMRLTGQTCELDKEKMPLHHWAALKRRWPFGAIASEVFLIDGQPDPVNDLNFANRQFIHVSKGLNCTDREVLGRIFDSLVGLDVMRVPVPVVGEGESPAQRVKLLKELG